MVTLVPQKFASQSSPLVGEDHERRLYGFAGREEWAAQMEGGAGLVVTIQRANLWFPACAVHPQAPSS
jgi:hypothetical protein